MAAFSNALLLMHGHDMYGLFFRKVHRVPDDDGHAQWRKNGVVELEADAVIEDE